MEGVVNSAHTGSLTFIIVSNKKSKKLRFERDFLTTLLERRMGGDRIKTFKIVNRISNHGRDFLTTP